MVEERSKNSFLGRIARPSMRTPLNLRFRVLPICHLGTCVCKVCCSSDSIPISKREGGIRPESMSVTFLLYGLHEASRIRKGHESGDCGKHVELTI